MSDDVDDELIGKITAFCDLHNMAESTFGAEAMNERGLVRSLREGRSVRIPTRRKILQFMEDHSAKVIKAARDGGKAA